VWIHIAFIIFHKPTSFTQKLLGGNEKLVSLRKIALTRNAGGALKFLLLPPYPFLPK
jgi:hypothetical protein